MSSTIIYEATHTKKKKKSTSQHKAIRVCRTNSAIEESQRKEEQGGSEVLKCVLLCVRMHAATHRSAMVHVVNL